MAVLFCAPLFVRLGQADFHGDEPIYAFAVDRMLETGDWWTPRAIPNETAPFLEKPPLKIWIVAAGIRSGLLPHNEFGQRFWDALFGSLAFLYVFAIGTRLGGFVCGAVAVFTLFMHRPLLLQHGLRSHNMEAALLLCYCGGVYHAIGWSRASSQAARYLHPLAVVAFFVLGFMTKFVAALFLPFMLVLMTVAFPAWRTRMREDWRSWLAAALIGAALASPWFIYQSMERGQAFWDVLFGEHVYKRMTASMEAAHIQPWHFYLTSLRAEIANNKTIVPVICGFLVLAVVTVRRRWDIGALVLAWFILPIAAISAGTSKLYHYAYPFLPPLALAAGFVIALLLDRERPSSAPGGPARWSVARGLEFLRARVPAFSSIAAALAIVCLAVAAATLANGRLTIQVGEMIVLRNSSVVRPALVGAALMLVSRGLSPRVILTLLVLAALPLDKYGETLGMLDDGRAPMRSLGPCLRHAAGGTGRGVYIHAETFGPWQHVYYFRGVGWEHPADRPAEALSHRLFTPEQHQPVLLTLDDYARLERSFGSAADGPRRLRAIASVRLDGERLLLLPGAYAVCASDAVHER